MPENTNLLLDGITQLESAAFRVGQVARRLLSGHPDLTVKRAAGSAFSYADGDCNDPMAPKLDVRTDGVDGARAWAQALGTDLTLSIRETPYNVYETGQCEADVDGVLVQVVGSRALSDDEATAWRTQQAQAATGGEPA